MIGLLKAVTKSSRPMQSGFQNQGLTMLLSRQLLTQMGSPNQNNSSDPFLQNPSTGLVSGNIYGIGRHTRTSDIISMLGASNLFNPLCPKLPWILPSSAFHSITDTRFPKRRPSTQSRRKRASLRPPGPYAWVKYVPGEPISPNNPNEGSVKRRNEKKRIKQHKAFILAEKKKRKTQLQEANRTKIIKRVERKMAAVARERAWAERLAELKKLEEENKTSMGLMA